MNRCDRVRDLLPLSAGGDLDPSRAAPVRAHLSECAACRSLEAEYLALIQNARNTLSTEHHLPEAAVRRIAAAAAEGVAARRWAGLPAFALLARQPALLGSVAALVVALAVLPLALRPAAPGAGGGEAIKIRVESQDGAVRLAWTDGNRVTYTVRKATNPRDLAGGAAYRVRGHEWVDRDPGSAPIVYYAIE
jgi:anti-sigma factor RsiW